MAGDGMKFLPGSVASFLNITGAYKSSGVFGLGSDVMLPMFPTMFTFSNTPFYAADPTQGSLSADGQTLTIPLHSSIGIIMQAAAFVGPFSYEIINFDGTVVATLVPEPSAMTLLGFGAMGLLLFARRRRS